MRLVALAISKLSKASFELEERMKVSAQEEFGLRCLLQLARADATGKAVDDMRTNARVMYHTAPGTAPKE